MGSKIGRAVAALWLGLGLAGCAGDSIRLVGRSSGVTASSAFPANKTNEDAHFYILKELYVGRWYYMDGVAAKDGGDPRGCGVGAFFGASKQGAILQCRFSVCQTIPKGQGICQDSKGETYDLAIN